MCGFTLNIEDKFCAKCGAQNDIVQPEISVQTPPPQPPLAPTPQMPPLPRQSQPNPTQSSGTFKLIAIGLCIALALGGAAWASWQFFLRHKINTPQKGVQTTQTGSPSTSSAPRHPDHDKKISRVVYDNGNIYRVFNKPKYKPKIKLQYETFITKIVNYHWNGGRGARGGTISLVNEDGTIYGPWIVTTSSGQGSAPNVYWTCTPNLYVPPGQYTVKDSDNNTWSQNKTSDGIGMSRVEGY